MSWLSRFTRVSVVAAVAAAGVVGMTGVAQAADTFEVTAEAGAYERSGSTETPFTQAGGVPDLLRVNLDFSTRTEATDTAVVGTQVGMMRDVETELPAGLQGNAMATPRCVFSSESGLNFCPRTSVVGFATLHWNTGNSAGSFPMDAAVFNVMPPKGVVARYAFNVLAIDVFIDMKVNDDGRYTISSVVKDASQALTVHGVDLVLFGVPALNNGTGAAGPYPGPNGTKLGTPGPGEPIPMLTMGNDCDAPQTLNVRARSWQEPNRWATDSFAMPKLTGCDKVPLKADLEMAPETSQAASPSGFTTVLTVPQTANPEVVQSGLLKKVSVKLPEGVAVNPGSAQGLVGCTDAQVKIRALGDPTCPDASKIGTLRIETPVLPGPIDGFVYLGQPLSQTAANGDMFRVFLAASGYGVTIKQEGRITPDPVTGQLTAVFDNIPQQPFSKMTLKFNGGPRAPLTTPTACGEHTTVATITGATGKQITTNSTFQIACRPGLFGFAPGFAAGVDNILAGASSPLRLSIVKPDGQQALTGVNLQLPKGLLANLKGNIGKPVGTVRAYAGLGAEPFGLPGVAYLEGPYGDAPFSLKVVVPAKAGPYDLGDVVVRQKLYVHPDTAQVSTVSDPLPTILQGVPVQLQRLDVAINKTGFMLNPTSCKPQRIDAGLSSVGGRTASFSRNFGIGGCRELDYKPDLDLSVEGELKNGGHPQLNATLTTEKGEANQKKAQVTLPLNLALDPQNAKALCEPSQVPTNSCPADSIVGKAAAVSILDVPLTGPVYFVRGERKTKTGRIVGTLPKLFIPLSGQGVRINVHASSDVVDDKLQTTFDDLPDAPIERFDLSINGGDNGILKVTNGDVCKSTKTPKVGVRMIGQNGKVHRTNTTLGSSCRFGIAKTSRNGNRIKVTLAGLTGGKITVSGKGIRKNHRTVSSRSTVASVGVSLSAASRRSLDQGETLRIKVKTSFNPSEKGEKTVSKTKTVVVKPAKK